MSVAILKLRRGAVVPSLTTSEFFWDETKNTLNIGTNDSGSDYVTLVNLNETNIGSLILTGNLTVSGSIISQDLDTQYEASGSSVQLTGDQVINGIKTFNFMPTFGSSTLNNPLLNFKNHSAFKDPLSTFNNSPVYTQIAFDSSGNLVIRPSTNGGEFYKLDGSGLTARRIFTLPNNSGTLALEGTLISGSSQLTASLDTRYLNISGDTIVGNLIISGNLAVEGTTTTVNTTTLTVSDNIIELNYGSSATTGGILIRDITGLSQVSGSIVWDSSTDYWSAGTAGNESKILLAGGDGILSGSSQLTGTTLTDVAITGSGNIDIAATGSFDGGVYITTNGRTDEYPATIGFKEFSSGEAAQFQFGDNYNVLKNQHGESMVLHAFHTIVLNGGHGSLEEALYTNTNFAEATATENVRILTDFDKSIVIRQRDATTKTADWLYFQVSGSTNKVIRLQADGFVSASGYYGNGSSLTFGGTNFVSGSSQISYPDISNIPSGIISSSTQLPSSLVSGSSQVDYTGLSNIPSGIISGSSQLTSSYDTRYELSGSMPDLTPYIAQSGSYTKTDGDLTFNYGVATTFGTASELSILNDTTSSIIDYNTDPLVISNASTPLVTFNTSSQAVFGNDVLYVEGTAPGIGFRDTNQTSTKDSWWMLSESGSLRFSSDTRSTPVVSFSRSGSITATGASFTGNITTTGAIISNGSIIAGGDLSLSNERDILFSTNARLFGAVYPSRGLYMDLLSGNFTIRSPIPTTLFVFDSSSGDFTINYGDIKLIGATISSPFANIVNITALGTSTLELGQDDNKGSLTLKGGDGTQRNLLINLDTDDYWDFRQGGVGATGWKFSSFDETMFSVDRATGNTFVSGTLGVKSTTTFDGSVIFSGSTVRLAGNGNYPSLMFRGDDDDDDYQLFKTGKTLKWRTITGSADGDYKILHENINITAHGITFTNSIPLYFGTSGSGAESVAFFRESGDNLLLELGTPINATGSQSNNFVIRDNGSTPTNIIATFARTTGNLSIAGTYSPSSDYKLKQNISDIDTTYSAVRWRKFNMKKDPNQVRYGVIAQELEEVHPELVIETEDGTKTVAYIDLLIKKIAELEERVRQLENSK